MGRRIAQIGRRNRHNIPVSAKHGINPSIPVCFWCGETKNEIALLGPINDVDEAGHVIKRDTEAPHKILADYDPCDDCRAKFDEGIVLFEADNSPQIENQPPYPQPGVDSDKTDVQLFPTGRWMVMAEEAISKIFTPEWMVAEVLRLRRAALDPEAYAIIQRKWKEAVAEAENG